MTRPSHPLRPLLGALIAAAVLAACGATGPGAGSSGATPTDAGSALPPGSCAIAQQPGPDDLPPEGGGDSIDYSDFGAGRYHLCLSEPVPIDFENSAWCRWNEARDTVIEVSGVPQEGGGRLRIDAGVSLERRELYFSTTEFVGNSGVIGSYQTRPGELRLDAADDGTSGGTIFDAPVIVDPEAGTPPGAAPAVRGAFVWLCGDPPPPA